jgi:DMSO/TMAO reductase YedYZ molybdopterin-dependent catalytic subunit
MDSMTRLDIPDTTPPGPTRGTSRRKFLIAGGGAAALAATAGFGGQYLQDKRFSDPGKQLSGSAPSAPVVKIGVPGVEQKLLPKGAEITDIPGLSPFYTPNGQFFRVDTALVVPKVSVQSWQLRIHGMVDRPITLSFEDVIKRPMLDQDITLTCVSDSVGGSRIGNARWQGIRLADVLREAGIKPGATQIVMRDMKGMNLGVATAPVMDGRDSLLAIGMNGQALLPEHGFPVRVVVPGLYGYVSACKWVVDMELTTFDAFGAFYTKLGWAAQAKVKTESRIDTPKSGSKLTGGKVMIAGVAWAQHKGIEAVEVGIDGSWHQATLAVQDVLDSWRQWYFPWQATPGEHTLQVRATDKTGYTQTAAIQHTSPNGATGYHTVNVTVA